MVFVQCGLVILFLGFEKPAIVMESPQVGLIFTANSDIYVSCSLVLIGPQTEVRCQR